MKTVPGSGLDLPAGASFVFGDRVCIARVCIARIYTGLLTSEASENSCVFPGAPESASWCQRGRPTALRENKQT